MTAKAKPSKASSFNDKSKRKRDFLKQDDPNQSASNKKRALKHARQSHRPHADVVVTSKEIWNKLRVKTNTEDQIKELMAELMDLLKGKFHQVAMQHDASRVVQAALQYGTEDQRRVIVKEICSLGNLVELSKVQYAHFVVLKMVKHSFKSTECMKLIVKVRPWQARRQSSTA